MRTAATPPDVDRVPAFYRLRVGPFMHFCVVAVLAASLIAAASLDEDAIQRALQIARAPDRDRARFHAPYVVAMEGPVVEELQVITEFRRMVLLAEDRLRLGDWMFTRSPAEARSAVAPWQDVLTITARLRFNPLNVYVSVPPYTIAIGDGPSAASPSATAAQAILSSPAAGANAAPVILGATIDCRFDAGLVGRDRRDVRVVLDGDTVAGRQVDFGALP